MGDRVGGTGCRAEKRLGEARAGAEVKAQSLWGAWNQAGRDEDGSGSEDR